MKFMFGTLFLLGSIILLCILKNVPLLHLVSLSGLLSLVSGIVLSNLFLGKRRFVRVFNGEDRSGAKSMMFSVLCTSMLNSVLGSFVILQNLANPDAIGPAIASIFLGIFYAVLFCAVIGTLNFSKSKDLESNDGAQLRAIKEAA